MNPNVIARPAGKARPGRKARRPLQHDGQAPDALAQAARLCEQGRHREALHAASEALRREPCNARLWNLGAVAAFALGLFADAERFWTVAIQHDPACAETYSNLGALYGKNGDLDAAERCFTRAVELDPKHARALGNLGALLVERERYAQALQPLRASLDLGGEHPDVLNNLALALFNLERIEEARRLLLRARALKPNNPDTLVNLALIHLRKGEDAAAERAFDAVLALDPANARALLFKTEQHRAQDGAWVEQVAAAYRGRGGRLTRDVIQLDFAMGKICEDRQQHADAFAAYAEGNRLHYARHPFDERSEQNYLETLTSEFTATVYRDPPATAPGPADAAKVPIFIVGMPRSGTTLVEQILAAHPEVVGAGELTVLRDLLAPVRPGVPPPERRETWLRELRELGQRYLEQAWRAHPGATFLVDKLPGNYRLAGLIPLMIPQARIIHMNRAPLDVCWSCFTLLFASGHEYAYDLGALGRQYVRYHRLMEHWRAVMPAGRLLEVRYEAVVADLERETRRILAHLGLDWHERCARFHEQRRVVLTASRTQVKRPLYSSSVGRWQSFEKHLAPLVQALEPLRAAP
jgi:Flp pilus assembly protein TadD